jgi:hypothetical protein
MRKTIARQDATLDLSRSLPRVRRGASSIAAIMLCSSCGGGPESEVKDTVKSYGKALAEGDGRTACGLVTADFRDQIAERTGGQTCEEAVEAQASQLTPDQRDALNINSFNKVTFTRSGASAEIADMPVEVLLVETENGWKIDSFGF